jgi:hypothetical protein
MRNPKTLATHVPTGYYFVYLDLADGYYTLGIKEEDLDFFTVNYRGTMWRLACLHMG